MIPLDSESGKIWQRMRHLHVEAPDYFSKSLSLIISTFALIITGFLINHCLPKQTEEIVLAFTGSIWKNLGIGLLFLILAPLCVIISISTAIGIPAGIILVFLYITMIYASRVYVNLWIGRKLLGNFRESSAVGFFWPLVIGTIIIASLLLIPIIGWFLRIFLLLIGLGAISQVIWNSMKPVKKT